MKLIVFAAGNMGACITEKLCLYGSYLNSAIVPLKLYFCVAAYIKL